MKIRTGRRCLRVVLCLSAIALAGVCNGEPLALSTSPAGSTYRKPAPNVIVSVDDSGSMGQTGMATLRAALADTFSSHNVPDGSIRLAWQSMNGCFTIPGGGDCANQNMMRVLDSTQRSRFMTWVATLNPRGNTPSHRMLFNAGEYMRMAPGIESPWASVPGTTQAPMLACRKAYDLFMTDGGWNSPFGDRNSPVAWNATNPTAAALIGNADGRDRMLGDGTTSYSATSPESRIYQDGFGSDFFSDAIGSGPLPTFADLAFHYWSTDLQPSLANEVPKRIAHPGTQTFGNGTDSQSVSEFWNPRNDPANWQHMTTYTVGFNDAAHWEELAKPVFGADTWTGIDFTNLVLGKTSWTNPVTGDETTRMPELWHAALNSRGKFIPAANAASLAGAFKDVLDSIAADTTTSVTSMAGSSYSTRSASRSFEAGYTAASWKGEVVAYDIAAATGAVSSNGAWGTAKPATEGASAKPVSTATQMDAVGFSPADRRVLSHDGINGIDWRWSALTVQQKAALSTLDGATDTLGESRLQFLRGDRSKEAQNGGTFRNRESRHGDIVNSRLWIVGSQPASGYSDAGYDAYRSTVRTPMVYVGANDGMLHGFSADKGTEKLAYVPNGLYGKLAQLSSPAYRHRYFVDGSPFSADLSPDGTWKTYLAGFPGAGGTGYFVLDITNPATFANASPLQLVVLDRTDTNSDADIGHIVSEPVMEQSNPSVTRQIARMNDNRWALVIGNGANSRNEQAVLLIQYLDGARELIKLKAGAAGGNGLGAPRLVDLNGDKKPDIVYAGDQKGNLWKFDVTGTTASGWKVALDGAALFSAKDASGKAQPIGAAPVWLAHPDGGVMVVFGTGRNMTDADRVDTSSQSVYGIRDDTAVSRDAANRLSLSGGNAVGSGRTNLVAQTSSRTSAGNATASGKQLWTMSSNAVDFKGANAKKGWYYDLPDAGERVLKNLEWFDGDLIDIASTVPAAGGDSQMETCGPTLNPSHDFLTTLNAISGAAPTSQIYSYNAAVTSGVDALAGKLSGTASRIKSSMRYGVRSDTEIKGVCAAGQVCDDRKRLAKINLRPSWRQLQ